MIGLGGRVAFPSTSTTFIRTTIVPASSIRPVECTSSEHSRKKEKNKKNKEGDLDRSPWAGKNPTAACKVGRKSITCESLSRSLL